MTAGSPRVTIFLIAYRQEQFIGDAVRSVLAQDYPNLQIILSDDCSPDATFALMQTEAQAYCGPHDVIVRQPPQNLGLVNHLYDVAALADGELLVCAEGDDIAYPHRVRALAEAWQRTGAAALVSNWDVIDDQGRLIRKGRQAGESDLRIDRYFPGRQVTLLTGATAAYSAEALRRIPRPAEPVWAEDLYVSLLLGWRGRPIHYVDEPLIAYRMHEASLSHVDRGRQSIVEQECDTARWSAHMATQLRLVERMIGTGAPSLDGWGTPVAVDRDAIREDVEFNEFRSRWLEGSVAERLQAFRRFRDPRHRRWLLPRLFGPGGVEVLRGLRDLFGRNRTPA